MTQMKKPVKEGAAAFYLHGEAYIEVAFDGYTFPPGTVNVFESVELIENVVSLVPMVRIKINDEDNWLQNEMALTDQNRITVTIKRDGSDSVDTRVFSLFKLDSQPYAHGFSTVILGTLDAAKWIQDTEVKGYKDKTATDVLKEVIGAAQLSPDSEFDDTSDKMTWLNPGLTRASFAQQVVNHCFKQDDALIRMAVLGNGTVRLVDVFGLLMKGPKYKLVYGNEQDAEGDFFVRSVRFKNTHGFVNSWASYGYQVFEPTLDGKLMYSDGIKVALDGQYAPFNRETYESVELSRYDYAPNECGNTYPEYWHNGHNNFRKSLLFTQRADVMIYEVTGIQLLDVVELTVADMQPGDEVGRVRGGKYIVAGKKCIVKGGHYAEALMLMRLAHNEAGFSKLLRGDGKGQAGRQEEPQEGPTKDGGESDWTYVNENRENLSDKDGNLIDGCENIVDEEVMPTPTDSTTFDEVEDFTDDNKERHGPYRVALTEKRGEVKEREKDTDGP